MNWLYFSGKNIYRSSGDIFLITHVRRFNSNLALYGSHYIFNNFDFWEMRIHANSELHWKKYIVYPIKRNDIRKMKTREIFSFSRYSDSSETFTLCHIYSCDVLLCPNVKSNGTLEYQILLPLVVSFDMYYNIKTHTLDYGAFHTTEFYTSLNAL